MLSILPRQATPASLEEHYGLAERPFGLTLDQRFLYRSQTYTAALTDVQAALQRREGLVVVTGEAGTGKTMLGRTLLRQLEPPVSVSIVLDPRVTFDDLLLHMLTDFGVIAARRTAHAGGATPTRHQLVRALQQFLASLIPLRAYAVLVIDEAQDLDPAVFEELRLLLNLETDEAKLLQIVLLGQPALNQLLRRPDIRQLEQRVARWCELRPLIPEEVKHYVEHRLSVGGGLMLFWDVESLHRGEIVARDASVRPVTFTSPAMHAVARHSRGLPRLINVICDRALEIGHQRCTRTIDAQIVHAAVRYPSAGRRALHGRRASARTTGAIAALMLLATGLGAWSWRSPGTVSLPALPKAFAAAGAPHASMPTSAGGLKVVESFNVRVASFKADWRATALVARLEAAGLPAFVRQDDAGWHQVVVGPYLTEEETSRIRDRVAAHGHPGSDIFVENAWPDEAGEGDATAAMLMHLADVEP